MEQESCFICGVKIGRGNRTEVGSQEKMEKLISVSNTVEHSRWAFFYTSKEIILKYNFKICQFILSLNIDFLPIFLHFQSFITTKQFNIYEKIISC